MGQKQPNTTTAIAKPRLGSLGGSPHRLIAAHDPGIAAGLVVLGAASWTLPERHWPAVGRLFAPLAARAMSVERSELEKMEQLIGARRDLGPAEAIAKGVAAGDVEHYLQTMRVYHPRSWRPKIRLIGGEHIEAALARGRGAVLWVGHLVFASLVAKMAIQAAGHSVSHLSHPHHGFSTTRFGMRFLNPVRIRAERRYLGERIVLSLTSSAAALAVLKDRLEGNGVVSITARELGRRPVRVPFLDGSIPLAAGAPNLARETDAALLAVFAVKERCGEFAVEIAPIDVDRDGTRSEYLDAAARDYARRLEAYVLDYPTQWLGWIYL